MRKKRQFGSASRGLLVALLVGDSTSDLQGAEVVPR